MLTRIKFTLLVFFGFSFAFTVTGPGSRCEAQSTLDKKSVDALYDKQVRPFFVRHCLACHGPEKAKGNLRLDRLGPDFATEANRQRWQLIQKRVQAGEMPPE